MGGLFSRFSQSQREIVNFFDTGNLCHPLENICPPPHLSLTQDLFKLLLCSGARIFFWPTNYAFTRIVWHVSVIFLTKTRRKKQLTFRMVN